MCTLQKRGNIYIPTLTGAHDHRLNPTLLSSIHSHLLQLHSLSHPPTALITTAHPNFFSNGYDLSWANSDHSKFLLMSAKFRSLISSLISLPMPTIAAVTGHASASGFILALSHDYVVMRRERGFLYMSELDIGMVIPEWFMAVVKCRIGGGRVRREVVLEAKKMTAEMGVERGIVDYAVEGVEGTVEIGEGLVKRGWSGDVYAKNRKVVMGEVLEKIGFDETVEELDGKQIAAKSKI